MTDNSPISVQFFVTMPAECPYLADRDEKKLFTHLIGSQAPQLHNMLAQHGFRRSQSLVYKPSCDGCQRCISVRVVAPEFMPSRSQKRVLARNRDVGSAVLPAQVTPEHYDLFRAYVDARHADGGMAGMSADDFQLMVEDSVVDTVLVEYRLTAGADAGRLVGLALTDRMDDGYSMVYSLFVPELPARSLGTYMVLDHIRRTQDEEQDFVYLGYWVHGSRKMDYKVKFAPLQYLTTADEWQHFSPDLLSLEDE